MEKKTSTKHNDHKKISSKEVQEVRFVNECLRLENAELCNKIEHLRRENAELRSTIAEVLKLLSSHRLNIIGDNTAGIDDSHGSEDEQVFSNITPTSVVVIDGLSRTSTRTRPQVPSPLVSGTVVQQQRVYVAAGCGGKKRDQEKGYGVLKNVQRPKSSFAYVVTDPNFRSKYLLDA
uniref:uncharacterized protein LOC107416829 isoform X1 n=1 Tax=Ziziphus jujuba TaxID=326968 RepID=A0A6P4AUD9_ZIZJJ